MKVKEITTLKEGQSVSLRDGRKAIFLRFFERRWEDKWAPVMVSVCPSMKGDDVYGRDEWVYPAQIIG